MKKIIIFVLLIGFGLFGINKFLYAEELSGKEILKRVDKNYAATNRISTGLMVIKGRRGTRTIKTKTWAQGQEKAFTEYLEPVREKGTKMLKLKDELWMWSPSTDRTIKIAGHMLRQSMSGSDISYEDFMEEPILSNSYEAKVTGEEKIGDNQCYVLELSAIKDVSYHSRKLWVDKERFLPLREDLFARGGKLLKTFQINEVFKVGERWYPKRMVFKDVLKEGDGTEFVIELIDFDTEIPEHIFSKASLRR